MKSGTNTPLERHGETSGDDKCKAMAGLIEGGTAHLEGVRSPGTRDLMMIAHCIRIEHYEIAAHEFTTLLAERIELLSESVMLGELLAEEMGMADALMLLEPDLFDSASFDVLSQGSRTMTRHALPVGYHPTVTAHTTW